MNVDETTTGQAQDTTQLQPADEQTDYSDQHTATGTKTANSLERFCEDRPDALECRIYDV